MKWLLMIPTYNENENLPALVARIRSLAFSRPPHLLVFDDNSPDGTGQCADRLAKADRAMDVLHRQKKEGLGRAYIDGMR